MPLQAAIQKNELLAKASAQGLSLAQLEVTEDSSSKPEPDTEFSFVEASGAMAA